MTFIATDGTVHGEELRISRRRTIAEHISYLAFDDAEDDDADGQQVPPSHAHSRAASFGWVAPAAAQPPQPTFAPASQQSNRSASGSGFLHPSSSTTKFGRDSDTASVKSRKSALEHDKAFFSSSLNKIFNVGRPALEKIMPRTTASVSEQLEVLAAFEVLRAEMKKRYSDCNVNPEIQFEAFVSRDNMIVEEEILFRRDRLRYCRASFAKYIGVPVEAVHEDDIPIIGVSGSGGGFKAMICTTGYLVAMEKEGLYDCVMYLSAVSGSCWTLSNLYRSAVATSPAKLAAYFIKTLPNHPADPSHLQANLAKSPLGRVTPLFGGLVDKRLAFLPRGVVDTYAVLMTAHFFSGEDREDFDPSDFKWSAQRRFMQGGRAPMPILTCIRHERPWYARVDRYAPEEYRRQQMLYEDNDETDMDKKQAEVQRNEAWWQWFELTPIQFGSDEQKIWIPTWSFGRKFEAGKSSNRCPEQSLSLQVGMVGSAMTAPFQTSLETLERSDPKSSMGKRLKGYAVKLLASGTSSLNVKSLLANHPFHSAYNWNPMYRILPSPQPPGLVNSPRIQLVDAGADNNQALYPFTRPGRKVDIMIVLDSSDDVERNIVTPDIEKFGKRKGFTFTRSTPTPPNFPPNDKTTPLSILYKNRYCQIFDGKANPPDKRVGEHGEPLAEADTTLIYIPTLTCDAQTPAFCPSDFSFAKLSYTLQECVGLLSCAEMNWMREKELIRATIKKCWERKRDARRRGC